MKGGRPEIVFLAIFNTILMGSIFIRNGDKTSYKIDLTTHSSKSQNISKRTSFGDPQLDQAQSKTSKTKGDYKAAIRVDCSGDLGFDRLIIYYRELKEDHEELKPSTKILALKIPYVSRSYLNFSKPKYGVQEWDCFICYEYNFNASLEKHNLREGGILRINLDPEIQLFSEEKVKTYFRLKRLSMSMVLTTPEKLDSYSANPPRLSIFTTLDRMFSLELEIENLNAHQLQIFDLDDKTEPRPSGIGFPIDDFYPYTTTLSVICTLLGGFSALNLLLKNSKSETKLVFPGALTYFFASDLSYFIPVTKSRLNRFSIAETINLHIVLLLVVITWIVLLFEFRNLTSAAFFPKPERGGST